MKNLILLILAMTSASAWAADTIIQPATNGGDTFIKLSGGKTTPVALCMTSDGSGNPIPCTSGGGGGGGGTVSIAGKSALAPVHVDFTGTPVTTSAYVQLVASTSSAITLIHVDSTCGQTIRIAVGGLGSEVDQFTVARGGSADYPLAVPSGSRISAKALSGNCSANDMDLSLFN